MTTEHDVYRLVHVLLAEEEQCEMASSNDLDLDECRPNLQRIEQLLSEIDKQVTIYRCRYERLVALSRVEQVKKWARDLLDLPHFAILDLYSDFTDPTERRRQVVVIDGVGEVLFKAVFTSFGMICGPNNDILPIGEGLKLLMSIIDGCFLGICDAKRVYKQLAAMADCYHVDMPALAGVNLFEAFQTYFQVQHSDYDVLFHNGETVALALLSERIGHAQTVQADSAKGRAQGMLQVLRAIVQGFVDPRAGIMLLPLKPSSNEENSPHTGHEGDSGNADRHQKGLSDDRTGGFYDE